MLATMRKYHLPNLSEVFLKTQIETALLVDHIIKNRLELSVGPVTCKSRRLLMLYLYLD